MRRPHLALALLLALASCRSALGIGDLETEDGPEAQGGASGTSGQASRAGRSGSGGAAGMGAPGALQGGGGSSSGAGTSTGGAGAAGTGAAGTGTAGTGTAGTGAAGTGGGKAGTGGAPTNAKACQSQCKAAHPAEALGLFFDVLQDCACEVDELPSCEPACNACLVQGGEFEGQTAQCVACLAAKLEAKECKESAKQCKGECKAFAGCLNACETP